MAIDRRGDARRTTAPDRELFSAADVTRTIARIAHQIIEKTAFGPDNPDDLVIVGIPTGGAVLARRLAAAIAEFTGVTPAVGTVDPTLYRDDLRRGPARPLGATALPDGGLDDRLVVLVDDVLFSGRTVRAALDALGEHGRPRAVQLAVLVDRGHRELPIRADYVGKNVPTAQGESIVVLLTETDGRDGVALRRAAESAGSGFVRHLLSVTDLDAASAIGLLDTADRLKQALLGREVRKLPTLRGRTVVTMFYENSTRTRVSFEVAGKWMSADTINVSASGSSVGKGESLRDTAATLAAIGADCIVVRHPASGAAHRMAHWADRDARRARSGRPVRGRPPAWSTPATGPTNTPPRRSWMRRRCATGSAGSPGGGSGSSGTCCTAGSPARTSSCSRRWAPRWCWWRRRRCCRSASRRGRAGWAPRSRTSCRAWTP